MSNWKQDSLTNHVSLITKGTTPTSLGRNFQENGINFIKAESITDAGKFILSSFAFIDKETHELLKRSQLQVGDILFSIAGVLGRIAVVNQNILPANTNQAIAIIRLSSSTEIENDFLKHFLNGGFVQEQIRRINVQAAQANFSLADINGLYILYPNKNIQTKIAKILSTADAVIEKTQAAIAKYKAIKQGMFHDLFTRGIDTTTNQLRPKYEDAPELYKESKLGWIPREWEEKIIDDVAKVNGRVGWKGYTVADLREFGPLALGATHINKENKLDLSNPIHLSMEKYLESPEIMVQFGDLLIVQRGTIGKIVVIDRQIGEATINPSMVLLNNIRINNIFLYYQLCSFIGQLQIDLLTTQTGVPMISQEQIKNINLAIPKKPKETDAIAERLKNIDAMLDNEQAYLQKMQSIKKGLMEDLLSGKKRLKK